MDYRTNSMCNNFKYDGQLINIPLKHSESRYGEKESEQERERERERKREGEERSEWREQNGKERGIEAVCGRKHIYIPFNLLPHKLKS